ncbi:C2H2 zinc finger [Ceratobasidium sp. AG-Ba]|nr:C2H2 zinc finger [Ceratobasidium sp. AG-Ba]
MNDYQTHFQNYSETFDSTSAMHLAYRHATYGAAQVNDPTSYDSQSWQTKPGYFEQSCGRPSGSVPVRHDDSLLYTSEFADPHSNLEIGGHDSSSPYPAYSSASGYPMTLEGTQPGQVHQFNETVAVTSSYLPSEAIYGTSVAGSAQYPLDIPSDSFTLSWPNDNSLQVSPRRSQDLSGLDTPPSPFSLARSKHSSTSPSPGPLTPAIGHVALQADLCTTGPSPQGPQRNLYSRNEDIDPDRPYPCGSCRMAFARQHDLTRHSRVHSGETPYHCHGCRQGFRRSDARSRHWGKDAGCLALHQRLVEGTEEGRKLQKSLSRLGEKAGRLVPQPSV